VLRQFRAIALVALGAFLAGCSTIVNDQTGTAVGEEHDVPYSSHDAFVLTQDALRSKGVLFEVKPDDKLVTLWKDADVQGGILGSLVGRHPQYRYEVMVVPDGERRAKIVVNVRTEDISDAEIGNYRATARLNLFEKIDQLAVAEPPQGGTPKEGGVNFAVLPNEDLKALAKRATGDENNWRKIAQDNGLKSPADAAGLPSVWISNAMLKDSQSAGAAPKSIGHDN
jgi:hypothetical protein